MTPVLHRHVLSRSVANLVYRGVAIGLLGAIACLLALAVDSARTQPARIVVAAPAPTGLPSGTTIVDVSRSHAGGVIDLLGLRPGERVVELEGAPATTDLVVDAWRTAGPGHVLDLTIASAQRARRVLVIIHR